MIRRLSNSAQVYKKYINNNDTKALINIRLNEIAQAITALTTDLHDVKAVVNNINRIVNLEMAMKEVPYKQ